jgi:flagellar basal-body rod protein FlgG
MAPIILDLKQGSLKKTNRQFDLAIEGEGFFIVRQDAKDYLTRCGAFTFDRDRQLCLAITREILVLQPPIRIPDDAREIQISARGTVTMLKTDDSDLVQIGQLQLGKVSSAALLTPVGNALLITNERSGALAIGVPMVDGFGEIQQGCLEESNVDLERELEEIDQLSTILKALPPQISRPATARNLPAAPHR